MTKNNTSTIETVSDFQEEVLKLTGSFAYRGESNKAWEVRSGAYRRLKDNDTQSLIEYTENIVNQANNYKQEIKSNNDLELLAELQHLGCATPLIDFSTNALTALWFACEDTARDGKVVCLKVGDKKHFLEVFHEGKTSTLQDILSLLSRKDKDSSIMEGKDLPTIGDKKYTFGKWKPPLNNHRIVKQDSLFIFTPNGNIVSDKFEKTFIIDKDSKLVIRGELEQLCGMTQTSIFPDLYGFAASNSADNNYQKLTVEELIEQGDKLYQKERYKNAKYYYTVALETAEQQQTDAIVIAQCQQNLGMAWYALGKPEKAIEYYELALEGASKIYDATDIGMVTYYFTLSSAWLALGETKKALRYFELILDVFKRNFGDNDPSTEGAAENVAKIKKQITNKVDSVVC